MTEHGDNRGDQVRRPSESDPGGHGTREQRGGALTDVAGLRVGHAALTGNGCLSGATVVLAPEGGMVAAVDVRGGGPGTKETDALDPRNVVQRIDAVVLTGGSAYGLDSASGVMAWLEEQGRGIRVGDHASHVVPVVPAACIFDLGRGGDFRARPNAATGRAAAEAAAASVSGAPVSTGCVGAGAGAVVGGLKGGVGTASTVLSSGITVAALVVVNAVGSALDPLTGVLYGDFFAGRVRYPDPRVHEAAQRRLAETTAHSVPPPLNTTLAVVATDAALTRAQAQKLAGVAHDGIARAVRPVHLLNDGDTVFALATGERPIAPPAPVNTPPRNSTATARPEAVRAITADTTGAQEAARSDGTAMLTVNEILAAGADQVTRAIVDAVRAAGSVTAAGGTFLSYRELYESP